MHPQRTNLDNCRNILRVSENASFTELRAAYLRQALQAHPDKGGTALEFQKVIAAFELLAALSKSAGGEPGSKGANDASCKTKRNSECGTFRSSKVQKRTDSSKAPEMHSTRTARRKVMHGYLNENGDYSNRFLGRLHALLSKIGAETRHDVVSTVLTHKVRLALHNRILDIKQSAPTSGQTTETSESETHSDEEEHEDEVTMMLPIQDIDYFGSQGPRIECPQDAAPTCHEHVPGVHPHAGCQLRGIVKRGHLYYASIFIYWLALQGKGNRELSQAVEDHACLVAIKRHVSESSHTLGNFEALLCKAIDQTFADFRCSSVEWNGWVAVPAFYWVGNQLKTPVVPWRQALNAWHRLTNCLGYCTGSQSYGKRGLLGRPGMTPEILCAIWKNLRAEYLKVVAEAGWSAEHIDKRLHLWEEARCSIREAQIRRYEERLCRSAKSMEERVVERIKSLLQQEEARVRRALQREARTLLAEQTRERETQRRRWKWNPNLTTADLLAGR